MLSGALLVALAAISWGTPGSVMTVLAAIAGDRPFVIGTARMWVAAVFLVAAARVAGPLTFAPGDLGRAILMGVFMAATRRFTSRR